MPTGRIGYDRSLPMRIISFNPSIKFSLNVDILSLYNIFVLVFMSNVKTVLTMTVPWNY